jgi:RNA polymerase sigma-70 factor (ECF subfamily)
LKAGSEGPVQTVRRYDTDVDNGVDRSVDSGDGGGDYSHDGGKTSGASFMSYAMTGPPSLLGRRAADGSGVTAAADAPLPEAFGSAAALDAAPDVLLVQRASAGDVAAFGILVQRYQRPMAGLVSRMVDNPEDVDDIVQELFIRAWKGLPRFRGDAQFSTWIYRIAVNTAIKYRSRRKGEATLSLSTEDLTRGVDSLEAPADGPTDQGGDPFLAVQRGEKEEMVRRAVQSLPDKQRSVVVLHYFEGRSCEEISQIVGCSLGTVWSRLHYACKRLRGVLETAE